LIDVLYRQTKDTDIAGMARIRAEEWGTQDYWMARISGYLECKVHPRQALMPRISYVAAEQDSIVGFVAGHLTHRYGCGGEIEWISVSRDHRVEGIASRLLLLLVSWFAEQKALQVCVDVNPANSAATKFYMRHGAQKLNDHWLVWKDITSMLAAPLPPRGS
jgi:ribosomal protein S18 acetylase RimI-like enzyme